MYTYIRVGGVSPNLFGCCPGWRSFFCYEFPDFHVQYVHVLVCPCLCMCVCGVGGGGRCVAYLCLCVCASALSCNGESELVHRVRNLSLVRSEPML